MAAAAVKGLVALRGVAQFRPSRLFPDHITEKWMTCGCKADVQMRSVHHVVMAFKTYKKGFLYEQSPFIRRMRIMAAAAAPGEGRVDVPFGEHRLVVACIAEVRLFGNK
jgi:hypothetical protein